MSTQSAFIAACHHVPCIIHIYIKYMTNIYHVYDRYMPYLCMIDDLQDCVATISPYPHYIGDRGEDCDVASGISGPDSVWVVCH